MKPVACALRAGEVAVLSFVDDGDEVDACMRLSVDEARRLARELTAAADVASRPALHDSIEMAIRTTEGATPAS